jgi:hypothetical protein
MHRSQTIRSELSPNQETRPSNRRRMRKSGFSVNRSLTWESAQKVRTTLLQAKTEIDNVLSEDRKEGQPILIVPKDHGVILIEKQHVMKALRDGLLRHLETRRLEQGINNHNYVNHNEINVPLEGFGWFEENSLVARIPRAIENAELITQTEGVSDLLQSVGAAALKPVIPKRISLCWYSASKDIDTASYHREEISRIVGEHFEASSLGSVTLGHLVVGDSYKNSGSLPIVYNSTINLRLLTQHDERS